MLGYLLELLYPTGWRRYGELYWLLGDCITAGDAAVDSGAYGHRILTVTVQPQAIAQHLEPREREEVGHV